MAPQDNRLVLQAAEAELLLRDYREMSDLVQCHALRMAAAFDLLHRNPERFEKLSKSVEEAERSIHSQLDRFQAALETLIGSETK